MVPGISNCKKHLGWNGVDADDPKRSSSSSWKKHGETKEYFLNR
jgi:hypothetical protein